MSDFSHISGDAALDLINTVEWRLSEADRLEDLDTYARVVDWCQESDLIDASEQGALRAMADARPAEAEAERLRVIAIRENAYRALFEDDAAAGEALAREYAVAVSAATLGSTPGRWVWHDDAVDLSTPAARIARAMVEFLRTGALDRLGQCADDRCGWVYLDTSPRRNRRWCVSSDCGDRNRARAYYARQRDREKPGSPD